MIQSFFLVIILILTFIPSAYADPSSETLKTETSSQVIMVETVQQLIDSIGSHRTIILKPGIYNLSDVQPPAPS